MKSTKKIISLMIAMILALSLGTISFADSTAKISITKTEVDPNTKVDVYFNLSNCPEVAAILVNKITYDKDALELVSGTTQALSSTMINMWDGDALSVMAMQNADYQGNILKLTFKAKTKIGTFPISCSATLKKYVGNDEATVTTVVEQGSITVNGKKFSGLSFSDKTVDYNSEEQSIVVTGVPSFATVKYECTNTTENKATNAGVYDIKAIVSAPGYNVWEKTAILTINKKSLTVTGLSAVGRAYNGTDVAEITGGTLNGAISGDDVSVDMPKSGKFASKNVGKNIIVSFDALQLKGTDSKNYTLTQPSQLKATIEKAPLTIKAENTAMITGSKIPDLKYNISGELYGETISGKLAVSTDGNKAGTYDITKGTIAVSNSQNFNVTFEKGTLTVSDKTLQNIVFPEISEKTYGDTAFNLNILTDTTSGLTELSYTSSDSDVATVDNTGKVTIKGAGETNITVKQAGNAEYAPWEQTEKLVVKKIPITINAEAKTKKIGSDDPKLTYSVVGELLAGDSISGSLARKPGEEIGQYDILIGTLAINDNYAITYNKATFEIVDKTPQNIVFSEIKGKTYGDADFNLEIQKDTTSNLENFTYVSSNENVATVDNTGKVTIKGAGETEIRVTEAGDANYAQTTVKQKLIVAKAPLTIKLDDISITYGDIIPDYGITYTGFVGGEDKNVLVAEPQVNGMPKKVNAGEYDLTLSGAEAINYEITYENAKLTVAKKKLSIAKLSVFDKAADETTIATINTSSITFTGLISGDDVKVDTGVAMANFTDATVGENKVVTVSNIAIIGNDVLNYELSDTTFATTGNIKDSITATDIATQISAPLVEKNAETLTFPELPEGYEIAIKSSDDETSIGLDGKIAPTTEDKTVKIVFTIKNIADETDMTDTQELIVTVPASDKVNITVIAEDNGTVTGGGEYPKNSEVTVVATANSGYKFSGWYNGETSVSTSTEYVFKAIDDVSLTAKFAKKSSGGGGGGSYVSTITVKYETNGGSEIESVKVDRNKTIAEPTAPIKDGYTFSGWYTDKELTKAYDFGTKVTKAFTLYAKWTENKVEEKPDETDKPETPEASTIPFVDVNESDWYYEIVKTAYAKGIMNGVTDKEFAPNTTVTRGMFVTVLYRIDGKPNAPELNFTDVESGAYYADAIAWANENNIVNGVSDTEFAPNNNITREQMATILFRYAQYKGMDMVTMEENLEQFTDSSEISEYAVSALNWAVGSNVMSGKGNGRLDPKGNATRAEAAAVLIRITK